MTTSRIIGFLLLPLMLSASAALADEAQRTISVSGQGKATAPPDLATINTGVVTQASTASEALAANNEAMQRILDVLKLERIAAKDVQTSRFDVRPEYKRDNRGRTSPQVVGYRVTNQVRVRVRNLPDLGDVLDALVDAGSNQVSGIRFEIDDPTGVLNQARNRAVADARSRANLYAHAAGVRVGKVLSISEQAVQLPRPQFFARSAEAATAGVPVATGEQQLQATVHMVFAISDED